jgi:hypothetical protein
VVTTSWRRPALDADHDGETYEQGVDRVRLNAQLQRVFDLMKDGEWRTLSDIYRATGDPEASVSARLRDLRKAKFGGFSVERRREGDPRDGIYLYRLDVTTPAIARS